MLPAYCEVRAVALPAINIEMRRTMEGWNSKYYQSGCGGFCGILDRADANPHAERHWGWRQIGVTHRVAQAMIKAFYAGESSQAIFQGCSTGGRLAHVAAQRYPGSIR